MAQTHARSIKYLTVACMHSKKNVMCMQILLLYVGYKLAGLKQIIFSVCGKMVSNGYKVFEGFLVIADDPDPSPSGLCVFGTNYPHSVWIT